MAEPAWFPFYVGDYLRKTSRLTAEQHGIYLLLLLDQWANGPLPDDDLQLAQIGRVPIDRWLQNRPSLERLFRLEKGVWANERVETERARSRAVTARRTKAGKASWNKRLRASAVHLQEQCTSNAPHSHIHKDLGQGRERVVEPSSSPSTDSVGGEVVRLPLPGRRTADGGGQ